MQQILIIHGGDAFATYEEYINYLKNKTVTLEKLKARDWKSRLGDVLGHDYEVLSPRMPNSQNARYSEWKIFFEKIIPLLNDGIILIGHSLGGVFLAKYLSENDFPKQVKATFLVAAPFSTEAQRILVDFTITNDLVNLGKQAGPIFIYHSKDDDVVPFSNYSEYVKLLPQAQTRILADRGHFNQAEFPEIINDIKSLN